MPGPAAALGVYANVIGIYSFLDDQRDEITLNFRLNQIQEALSDLNSLSTATVNGDIAQSLGGASTALDQLTQYRNSESAEDRAAFATTAVLEATDTLSELISIVSAQKGLASAESLAYMVGALQYAIIVRMKVADTVQDGPYGAAGLLLQVKTAAQLIYDQVGGNDIYSEFPRAISSRINYSDLDVNLIQTKVEFSVTSSFSNRSEDLELTRRTLFTDTLIPLPYPEPDSQFEGRIDSAANAAFNRIYAADYAEAQVNTYLGIGVELNTWLAQDAVNVVGLYERIGDSTDNVEEGTNNADYFSGLAGDDWLTGKNGPDALVGGSGNDILLGGALQDNMTGGSGNDFIVGNEAIDDPVDGDTARFDGDLADYEVIGGQTYAVVIAPDGSRDKLFNIEFLHFEDTILLLGEGSALDNAQRDEFTVDERVALLYEAALDRNGEIDLAGLNFYIEVTERDSLSNEFLAADLMNSPEFTAKFGDVNTLSNDAFLEQIYLNVLDRASDGAGKAFYLDLLDDGSITRALALADIATSPENTQGSAEILMSLFEGSSGEWRFISDGMEMV